MSERSSPDTSELLNRAEHYLNCNAAESGADVLIAELADALRASLQPATPTAGDDCACGGGDISGHDTMCPEQATAGDAVASDAKAVMDHWRNRFPNNAYAWPGSPEDWAIEAVKALRTDVAGDVQAATPSSLQGMIAAIYGELDAEDCNWIDREWIKWRGRGTIAYVLTGDAAQPSWQPIETAPHETDVLLGWWYIPPWKDSVPNWETELGWATRGWAINGISTRSAHGSATHWMPIPQVDPPALAIPSTNRHTPTAGE